jgi:hypothetical protein
MVSWRKQNAKSATAQSTRLFLFYNSDLLVIDQNICANQFGTGTYATIEVVPHRTAHLAIKNAQNG